MKGIIRKVGADAEATQENIEKYLAGTEFFWLDLDLHDPGPDDDVAGLLTGTFHFHPLGDRGRQVRPAGQDRRLR